jgi:hypothetical protein
MISGLTRSAITTAGFCATAVATFCLSSVTSPLSETCVSLPLFSFAYCSMPLTVSRSMSFCPASFCPAAESSVNDGGGFGGRERPPERLRA